MSVATKPTPPAESSGSEVQLPETLVLDRVQQANVERIRHAQQPDADASPKRDGSEPGSGS